ncbi:MAG: Gfo/Idh/MocA family oxidoreductase [Chloroflexota bacterium]|nr:MAG: Gfo/Idh/MocA family oxidoreductase [Chloroflexota bacterium]
MAKTRIGIIGTGTIANSHATALQNYPGGEIVAVFDVLGDRAQAYAEKWHVPNVCTSIGQLLAMKEVDAVIVSTPPFAHAEPTMKALQAGKHVLCEKPFALDPNEAQRMVQIADRSGKFLACASARNRCDAAQRKAHEMMESGELGDVYHVRSSRWRFRGRPGHHIFPDSHWFLDMQRAGGGAMMDIAVYQIDTVLWLLGNPKVTSVMASMKQFTEEPPTGGIKQDVEDHVVIMIAAEGGKSAIVEAAWVANMKGADGFYMFGTKAGLRFDPLTKITAAPVTAADGLQKTSWMGSESFRAVEEQILLTPDNYNQDFGSVTQQFVDAIAAGRQPYTPGKDALEITRVIHAAYESVKSGKMVALV